MTQYNIETRGGLPPEMQALLREHPRDTWPGNPNFAASIQNWMGAHTMFRQLGELITNDTEQFLNKDIERDLYVKRLAHFGTHLVRNLHGHHSWEDRSFFPELEAADPRFERGLAMLETDHEALDKLLDQFTTGANRTIQLSHLDPDQVVDEAALVHKSAVQIERFLNRHLSDEEDLAVPILLQYGMLG
jgi:hemerythrin-like domain-containing protein